MYLQITAELSLLQEGLLVVNPHGQLLGVLVEFVVLVSLIEGLLPGDGLGPELGPHILNLLLPLSHLGRLVVILVGQLLGQGTEGVQVEFIGIELIDNGLVLSDQGLGRLLILTKISGVHQGLLLVNELLGVISGGIVLLRQSGGLELFTAFLGGGLEGVPLVLDLDGLLLHLALGLSNGLK